MNRLGLIVVAGAAGAVVAGAAALRWRHDPDNDVVVGMAYVFGIPWALAGAAAAVVLVRAVPDLWRRRVVEGRVIHSRVERKDDNGVIERYSLRLAIDDGTSDRVVAYPLGEVRAGRLSGTRFEHLKSGDTARLTVAPGYGHVVRVEPLHDREGRPIPPVGVLPAPPPGAWRPDDPRSVAYLRTLDELIAAAIDAAPDAALYATADHGMNDKARCWDLAAACANRGTAWVWLERPADEDAVAETIAGLDGVEAVLGRSEAARAHRLLPERIGDLVVLGDVATVFGELTGDESEALEDGYRSHGGPHEKAVPLVTYNTSLPEPADRWANADLLTPVRTAWS